jgi:hypothetical protein
MKEVLKDKGNDGSDDATGTLQGANSNGTPQVLSRTIPPAVVELFLSKIASIEGKIAEMLEQER